MSNETHDHRHLGILTPLGKDAVLLRSAHGTEALSRLFEFNLELSSTRANIAAKDLLGQNVTLRLNTGTDTPRYFNGYVSAFGQSGAATGENLSSYHMRIVPWLWFLSRSADCRIFQDMSVPEIVEQIFKDRGFADFKKSLSGSYNSRTYTVQYRETDFNFISRLLEHEGVYYFFTHENGKHTMVLADSPAAHDPYPSYESVRYHPKGSGYVGGDEINYFSVASEVQSGAYSLSDFDFQQPSKVLSLQSTQTYDHPNGNFEMFDFPGDYTAYGDGQGLAKARIQELAARYERYQGGGEAQGMAPGHVFELTEPPRSDWGKKYLVLSVSHEMNNDAFEVGGGIGGPAYTAQFTAIDSTVQYRPPRLTPKPVVQGPQTAIVVGKSGEEIWTDQYGRIKVQFHWDRRSKADETSSCWIRVAHNWAGNSWGTFFLPRIGQEVVVEFMEGDPDRPIVTGCVYNGANSTPYSLPANATRSTIKTMSTTGGDGFNELRFEDKDGEERIFIHAEHDQHHRVKNDHLQFVGNNEHWTVQADQMGQVSGDRHATVNGDCNSHVNGTQSLTTGMDLQQKIGLKHAMEAGVEIHLKAGMNVVIEAGMTITLQAGGSFVTVGPSGVAISGAMVLINSGGSPTNGSGCSAESPKTPDEPEEGEAGEATDAPDGSRPPKAVVFSAAATAMQQAASQGAAFVSGGPTV